MANGDPEHTQEPTEVAVTVVAPTTLQNQSTLFGGDNPAEIVARATAVANALSDVIERKELFVKIRGQRHVKVGGWTLLGSMLGVYPICVWTKPIEDAAGINQGWEARVEARTLSGALVGAAEAQCLRTEGQWGWEPTSRDGKSLSPRDDFALRSMAQTRATAKCMRLPLGFIVELAGYNATPAEEMSPEGSVVATEHTLEPTEQNPEPISHYSHDYCQVCGGAMIVRMSSKGYEFETCELDYNRKFSKDKAVKLEAAAELEELEATNPHMIGKKHTWRRVK